MNTPIALDEVPPEEEAVLRERAAVYKADFEEWDVLVEGLLGDT